VFLKLDTQRIPMDLVWENGNRRLRIVPQVPLSLRRTYTVILNTLRSPAGGTTGWFYQFTTNSLRRPSTPRPPEGTKDESPYVIVTWDSTEISAGNIRYELWAGPDSNLTVNRIGSPVVTTTRGRWLPTTPWTLGSRVFWAISAINSTTGEVLPGPTHRFDIVDASTPQDSLVIPADDSGYNQILTGDPVNPYQFCGGDSLLCGLGLQCWISFPLAALPADVKVASAVIEVAVHQTTGTRIMRFQTPLLTSHIEASVRRGNFYGYTFTATSRFALGGSHASDPTYHPVLKIHYFRTSSAPVAAVAP
jgi:hypothetical protein